MVSILRALALGCRVVLFRPQYEEIYSEFRAVCILGQNLNQSLSRSPRGLLLEYNL